MPGPKPVHASEPNSPATLAARTPMAEVIRARVRAAGARFFANDNIAAHFRDESELLALESEVATHVAGLLESLVIDTANDHNTQDTARRVARMFVREVFRGRFEKMPVVTEFPNVSKLNELMIVGPVTVRSACSHHLVPILGKVWIGILPSESSQLIGLSKFSRICDWVMSRPQIQEEAIQQLADKLEEILRPQGLAIVMDAEHFCMHWRGVKDESHMTNSVMRGAFLGNEMLRKEFLSLMSR